MTNMIGNATLPQELISAIGAETPDFAVEAKRTQPISKSVESILWGFFMGIFMTPFIDAWIVSTFKGGMKTITINGVPTEFGPGNWWPILLPVGIISVFIVVSIFFFFSGVVSLFSRGGLFVGTPARLIKFKKNKLESIDWEQFNGNIEVKKDNISLEMRTGKMMRQGKSGSRYVPNVIYISGIPNAFEVGAVCRQRIKENDPTPAQPAV